MWSPDFNKIDLLALYATMYLKRLVLYKLPWKENMDILISEIKLNMEKIGEEKFDYLFHTLRDYSRVHCSQWSLKVKEYDDIEIGQPTFNTLLLVLSLRLGLQKLWVPAAKLYREDILIDEYLSQKPTLKLKYLSTGEPHYSLLVSLSPELVHLSMPFCDNAVFTETVKIKSLRILEFTTGVTDKVLCHALWNIDKKSDKLLQMLIKDKKEAACTLSLPNLEVFRSNIDQKDTAANSMKVSLGATALILQSKLRLVENQKHWSTLEAVNYLIEMEKKYNVKHKRSLAVEQLLFGQYNCDKDKLLQQISSAVDICPSISNIAFTRCSSNLLDKLNPIFKSVNLLNLEKLSLDISLLATEKDLYDILHPLENLKNLTLRISTTFIKKFHPHKRACTSDCKKLICHWLEDTLVPKLKSLSLVLCQSIAARIEDEESQLSTYMISFLYWFSHIERLYFYNVVTAPPSYVVYGCVGGALAVMNNLKHISLIGHTKIFPSELWKLSRREEETQISDMLPELLEDVTFNIIKKLDSFEIDELFITPRVDSFIEALRACNVHVIVNYRPLYLKGTDQSLHRNFYNYQYELNAREDLL